MSRKKSSPTLTNSRPQKGLSLCFILLFSCLTFLFFPMHHVAAPLFPFLIQSEAANSSPTPSPSSSSSASSSSKTSQIFDQAVSAWQSSHLKAAQKGFEELIFRYPDAPQVAESLFYLGEIYEKQNLLYEAQGLYRQFAERYPNHQSTPEALIRQAEISYRLGEVKKAQKIFKQILFHYPNSSLAPKVAFRLGDCLYESGDTASSRLYYDEGMKRLPSYLDEHPQTAFNIGSLYLQDKRLDQALSVFLALGKNHPKFEAADKVLTFCGDIYAEQGKIAEAVLAYQRVIESYPDSIGAQVSQIRMADLGVEYPQLKNSSAPPAFRDPIAAYRQMIQRKNTDPVLAQLAEYKLALALQKKEEHKEAIGVLRSLLAKAPKESIQQGGLFALKQELVNYLNQCFQRKDYLGVIKLYEENKNLVDSFLQQQKTPLPYFRIAQSYQNLRFYPPAIQLYRQAQTIIGGQEKATDSLSPQINFQLGWIFFQTEEYQKAIDSLKQAVSQEAASSNSTPPRVSFFALSLMGDICRERKDYPTAISYYQASLKLKPPRQGGVEQLLKMGQCYRRLGKISEAIESFSEAVNLAQGEKEQQVLAQGYLYLADCQYQAERYSEALVNYRKAQGLSLPPQDRDWVLYQIGNCLLKEAKPKAAGETFAKIKAATQDPIWPIIVDFKESEINRASSDTRRKPL